MSSNYQYLAASNGSGDAPLMHLTSNRAVGATVYNVDSVTNVPNYFIGTCGTLLSSGFIDTTTKIDFFGHLSGSTLVIDSFCPGSTDTANTAGQVIVIKPSTKWANLVAQFIANASGNGTPETLTAAALTLAGNDLAPQLNPTGALLQYAGGSAPAGWLLCQGQAVSRSTYSRLFAAIASTYGAGDGSLTFNVPDFRGRMGIGLNSGDTDFATLGQTGGQKTVQAHTHGIGNLFMVNNPTSAFTLNDRSADAITAADNANPGSNGEYWGGTKNTLSAGAGATNMNPYLVINWIIKT